MRLTVIVLDIHVIKGQVGRGFIHGGDAVRPTENQPDSACAGLAVGIRHQSSSGGCVLLCQTF